MRLVWAAIAILLAPACEATTGQTTSSIVDGTPTDGHAAVVGLAAGGSIYCTGTLVSARVIVTAAHCLRDHRPDTAFFGASPANGGAHVPIIAAREEAAYDPITLAHDIGVAILERDAPVAPIALPERPFESTALRDRSVTVVGFGATFSVESEPTRKREGQAWVEAATTDQIRTVPDPGQPCRGDSGGPVLLDDGERWILVGVVSSGDAACREFAIATRVDAYRAFLDRLLAATRASSVAVGGACFDDDACVSGRCHAPDDAPRTPYCTSACAEDHDACPRGMRCQGGSCMYEPPSPGALGAACITANDCEVGACVSKTHDVPVCAVPCDVAHDACPEGFTCQADVDGTAACLAASLEAGCRATRGDSPYIVTVLVWLLFLRRRRRR